MRARIAAVAALAALVACGKTKVAAPGVGLAQPASLAPFRGVTIADPSIQSYVAIANQLRNDLTLVNANVPGAVVLAPIQLRSLAVNVQFRPAIVVSSSLGDGDDKADLLVVIGGDSTNASGNSSLQLIRTWQAPNEVVADQTVDVTGEVLAAVAVPNPTGTTGKARIALALSGHRVAIVQYSRVAGSTAIERDPVTPPSVGTIANGALAIQPVALAAADDGSTVYAATLDEVAPGVFGVAKIDVSAVPVFAGAIDARGPTRLVAAAALRERVTGSATSATPVASAAPDATAFGWPSAPDPVRRVYAVLDESGCGPTARIGCGVVVLDPGTGSIRNDVTVAQGTTVSMPYLAPIPLPSRALAIAVSLPPAVPPAGETIVLRPGDTTYHGDLMRLWPAIGTVATTAVAAVAADDGRVYFLDLGRWKMVNNTNAVLGAFASVKLATTRTAVASGGTVRLSLQALGGTDILGAGDATLAVQEAGNPIPKYVMTTPGYLRDDVLTMDYQGALPSLTARRAEAVGASAGEPWLAMQVTGGSIVGQVVRLWDPTLGVRANDVVQIDAAAVAAIDQAKVGGAPACVGTVAPGAEAGTKMIFEARVAALVPPSAAYPGGAVQLAREVEADIPLPLPPGSASAAAVVDVWGACFDRLAAAAAGGVANLTATILAGGFSVTSTAVGLLDRPALGTEWKLDYDVGEDTLSCPLVPWPADLGSMACDATCRDACDHLLRLRKARRVQHIAETCGTDENDTQVKACLGRFPKDAAPGDALPDVAGPAVRFELAIDAQGGAAPHPRRGLSLSIVTASGLTAFSAPSGSTTNLGSVTHPNGVVRYDRSPSDAAAGYRFYVPYIGDWVLDTSPSVQNAASGVIR